MNLLEHFIGGKLISGSSDRKSKVFNPATGEQESEVRLANKADIDKAVEISKKAFETWSLKPALHRARVMFKFKELIEKNADELTKLIVSEHGKVYEDAKGSLTRGLEVVEFACGIPHLLKGEFSQNVGTNIDSCTLSLTGSSAIPFPVSNRAASISVSSFRRIFVCASDSNLADLKLVGSLTCKTLTGSSGGRNACGSGLQSVIKEGSNASQTLASA